ncbi:hypothetical protein ES703_81931 [subsurface metagenome]
MFYSTEQAVEYGLKADALHLARLLNLRQVYRFQCELALNRDQVNLAVVFATQAQFCREALNAETVQKRLMD